MADSAAFTFWKSRLMSCLDCAAAVIAAVLLSTLAMQETISWIVWLVVGLTLLLLIVSQWPYGALFVLIACSAMPRFFIEIFAWKARPEHLASVIVCLVVVVWFFVDKPRVRLDKLDCWILAYLAINYISSAFGSPEPSATLRWALQNNLAVLPYFLIRFLVRDLETLGKAFRIMLGVGIAEAVYGIFCYASHHALGSTFGMDFQYMGDVAAPYGSLFESNLFGAYTGCCAVLFLARYVGGQHRLGSLAACVVASLAAILSFSRAALLALIVAVCWVFWKEGHAKRTGRRRLATFVLPAAVILLIAASAFGGVLQERFSNLYYQGLSEETTITRFVEIQEALQDIPQHPLLGSGTASFQLSFDWGKYVPEWGGKATWVGNVTIRLLHDTGLLGLATLLAFCISLWGIIRKISFDESSQNSMLLGLSAGLILYGISFQATDGTILAFSWVHLGFLASAALLMRNPNIERGRAPEEARQSC
jgi:O-antigen ligase